MPLILFSPENFLCFRFLLSSMILRRFSPLSFVHAFQRFAIVTTLTPYERTCRQDACLRPPPRFILHYFFEIFIFG